MARARLLPRRLHCLWHAAEPQPSARSPALQACALFCGAPCRRRRARQAPRPARAALVFEGIGVFDVGVACFLGRLDALARRWVPAGPATAALTHADKVAALRRWLAPLPARSRRAARRPAGSLTSKQCGAFEARAPGCTHGCHRLRAGGGASEEALRRSNWLICKQINVKARTSDNQSFSTYLQAA